MGCSSYELLEGVVELSTVDALPLRNTSRHINFFAEGRYAPVFSGSRAVISAIGKKKKKKKKKRVLRMSVSKKGNSLSSLTILISFRSVESDRK